jgi:hypothetical protein
MASMYKSDTTVMSYYYLYDTSHPCKVHDNISRIVNTKDKVTNS